MVLKALFKELRLMYYSFFRPPSVDLAIARREKFSIVYAMSSFSLFVFTSFLLFRRFKDPEFVEKATIKPSPDAKRIKIEFDAKKFTFSAKIEENEDLGQENDSS